jgi:hypothetical protein
VPRDFQSLLIFIAFKPIRETFEIKFPNNVNGCGAESI